MVCLTLRNIPEEILKRLKIIAVRDRRSLNSELLITIEQGLAARLAAETSVPAPGQSGGNLSAASREKIWGELCGSWQDSRTLQDTIYDVYSARSGEGAAC